MVLQEDTIRRNERERKTMLDQISGLERQLLAVENEKKQILVRISLKYEIKIFCFVFLTRKKWAYRNQAKHV